jgi:hypothetical protein
MQQIAVWLKTLGLEQYASRFACIRESANKFGKRRQQLREELRRRMAEMARANLIDLATLPEPEAGN